MKRGLLVPNNVVLDMIKEKMLENKDSNGFVIDGYPREVNQGTDFEKQIVPSEFVLYVDATDATMKKRLKKRGETSDRVDDNDESINQRLDTFHESTQPVIDHYEKAGKLRTVNGENDPNTVFAEVKKIFEDHAEAKRIKQLNIELIDKTVDKIVQLVIKQAANRQQVVDNVTYCISNVFKDILLNELKENKEIGFSFLEYDHIEIYQGPTRLFNFVEDEGIAESADKTIVNEPNKKSTHHVPEESDKHGEIIIRVHKDKKVDVRADQENDTVISNISAGEIIIRNVDTNLLLNMSRGGFTDTIELSIVGQAYLKDVYGSIKCRQFKGIVVVKNDL